MTGTPALGWFMLSEADRSRRGRQLPEKPMFCIWLAKMVG